MRYIFLMVILYFAFKAAGNLLEAVQDSSSSPEKIGRGGYPEEEIEDAQWEDIE
jgi:hypothetical protein